jgi:nucleoside-diphosphate-sugar epimerase
MSGDSTAKARGEIFNVGGTEEISILKLARLVVKNAGFKIENSTRAVCQSLSACAERLRRDQCARV